MASYAVTYSGVGAVAVTGSCYSASDALRNTNTFSAVSFALPVEGSDGICTSLNAVELSGTSSVHSVSMVAAGDWVNGLSEADFAGAFTGFFGVVLGFYLIALTIRWVVDLVKR